ncbi:ferredoxin [Rhodococcus rhodochrous]|nr:ferredoxin [Rhodococcus rhodochrous]
MRLKVVAVRDVSNCVRGFRLAAMDGSALPAWEPGAHLDLVLPSGLIRQYSLCGDPAETHEYEIAVLREPESRGGSVELHDRVEVGDALVARDQRNHFPLQQAPSYLFVAGGVGITPIIPMIREAVARGAQWRLVYGGRTRSSMAFIDRVTEFGSEFVDIVAQDERGLPDLAAEIAATSSETQVYSCGPEGLLRAIEDVCTAAGRRSSLHLERFGASSEPQQQGVNAAFEVELKSTGAVITVDEDTTILDAVRTVLPDAPASCEEGFCGTCETRVLAGTPEHRDSILSEDERESNETMMICVGRSCSPRLVLDL